MNSNSDSKFEVLDLGLQHDTNIFPPGTLRITFRSAFDLEQDWAFFCPAEESKSTIVYLHGSFSNADQIFTRKDIRDFWLHRIIDAGHSLLSINMRGTSYMSPAATQDLTDILDYCQTKFGCEKIILVGGSGGASSAMAYACVHPEKIDGVIAMGMCDILARLDFARKSENEVLTRLAETTFAAYGGTPEEKPQLYKERSVLLNARKLDMPIILTMGEADPLIPVVETRKIAEALSWKDDFTYFEIQGGNHDSACWVDIDLEEFTVKGYCPET